ncbi:hypothetical protein WJX84_001015 [Apatococcus fuscideae]|uniref:Uncharacterized protein n=1 Tax=Apatococcus fuscideae TaxID=2026836 RepID=A0AAW1T6N7_9CHLO
MGAPKWPAMRQAFRLVKRPNGNLLIASDGLSDPFDDITLGEGNVNGFGLEFFIETPADELPSSLEDIKASWQFQLLYTVSQLAAGHGGIRAIMDDMKLLSTEAEGVAEAVPGTHQATHVNSQQRVGALLGLKSVLTSLDGNPGSVSIPEKIPRMPLTEVKLVNIKLLDLEELKIITESGAAGRKRLSDLFTGHDRLVSSLKRPSVVGMSM